MSYEFYFNNFLKLKKAYLGNFNRQMVLKIKITETHTTNTQLKNETLWEKIENSKSYFSMPFYRVLPFSQGVTTPLDLVVFIPMYFFIVLIHRYVCITEQ